MQKIIKIVLSIIIIFILVVFYFSLNRSTNYNTENINDIQSINNLGYPEPLGNNSNGLNNNYNYIQLMNDYLEIRNNNNFNEIESIIGEIYTSNIYTNIGDINVKY